VSIKRIYTVHSNMNQHTEALGSLSLQTLSLLKAILYLMWI